MYSSGNETVDKIGLMNIEGNVIPFNWFSVFKFKNGKPDLNAIVILSEIVYWYRPKIVRDEDTGATIGVRKKFKADLLQRSYESFAKQFGLTKRQVKEAFDRLCEFGVVIREFRTVKTDNSTLFNVLFIGLDADIVSSVSMYHPPTLESTTLLRSNVPPHTLKRNTYTETTTENTTDKKQSSFSEKFEKFWNEYPKCKRKGTKEAANKTFTKYQKDFEMIMKVLGEFKKDEMWTKNNGEFIAAPSSWLNKQYWKTDYWIEQVGSVNQAQIQHEAPRPQVKAIRKNYLNRG
ncbi:hypothetical protein [Acinetobacter phage vB_AbM_WUPSU]|nr:hypothetical protein [Acinetobacter phage vB_AbM_WUPSU]